MPELHPVSITPMAYLWCALGALVLAAYGVASKKALSYREWSGRPTLFTALLQLTCAIASLTISVFTGGPKIAEGLPFWQSFWFAVFATGLLNVGIQNANNGAKAQGLDVSIVSPISATTPAFAILASLWLLGENPSKTGWVGIMLLVVGTYTLAVVEFVNKKRKDTKHQKSLWDWLAPFTEFFRDSRVRLVYFGVLLSIFSLQWDGLTARAANVAFGYGMLFCITGTVSLYWAKSRGELSLRPPGYEKIMEAVPGTEKKVSRAADPPDWFARLWADGRGTLFLGVAGLFVLAHLFFGWAYRESLVPYTAALKRLQIPLTIILAFVFLGEGKSKDKAEGSRLFRGRLLGGLIMTVGAILIGLSDEDVSKWLHLDFSSD